MLLQTSLLSLLVVACLLCASCERPANTDETTPPDSPAKTSNTATSASVETQEQAAENTEKEQPPQDKWDQKAQKIMSSSKPLMSDDKVKQILQANNCGTCHTIDGSPHLGPSLKGLYGKKQIVVSDGKEREVVVDEGYLLRSLLKPSADLAKGYQPVMPPANNLTDEQLRNIIAYIKRLK